ncbi:MAG TPA: hypothetical protein VGE52_19670 [Pirellulales bacterium]
MSLSQLNVARATPPAPDRRRWTLAIGVWAVGVLAGWSWFAIERGTPGETRATPATWPAQSAIVRDTARPTLVLFAHPRCPCTRATLEEFAKLASQAGRSARLDVAFFAPSNADSSWTETDQYRTAAAIPGVAVWQDVDGAEATWFGAATSGQVVLYDRNGSLLFSGGLTPGRGHVGDNDGRAALVACLAGDAPMVRSTPVFGCSILVPPDQPPVRSR